MDDRDGGSIDLGLRVIELRKSYFRGSEVPVLRGVDLEVRPGEFVSITGSSGSGKSTLLHLVATLDAPDAGEVHWNGARIDDRSNGERDRFRNEVVGLIFQFYHLLPELSAVENVMLPAMIDHSMFGYLRHKRRIRRQATELLERVGLGHRLTHKPSELSGGEMQRTAIARALLTGPQLVLADEPTGNLDAQTGAGIIDLLVELNRELGVTIVMATHDAEVAHRATRRCRLVEGHLEPTDAEFPPTAASCEPERHGDATATSDLPSAVADPLQEVA